MLPKLVITDIDGVWTDGGMYYTEQGDVMKRFSVKDGWGVIFLRKLNIPVAIMTGENTSPHSMGALVPFVSLWRNCFLIMGCLKECFSSFYPEVFSLLCRP